LAGEPKVKALLLSGGIDSICLAYWHRPALAVAITIDYGQKSANAEIVASKAVCDSLQIRHRVIKADCSALGKGDMSNNGNAVLSQCTEWWPYRNQLLITLGCMAIIETGISELLIGTVLSDKRHRDGTKEFIKTIRTLVCQQEGGIVISAPGLELTTTDLVIQSQVPASFLSWAHSCHTSNTPCGNCNGCNKHLEVMLALGLG